MSITRVAGYQELDTMKASWDAKKEGWKKDFIKKINECFTNHDALTRAFNQRESLDKKFQENDSSPFVQVQSNTFTNAELALALHSVNNPDNKGTVELTGTHATYLIHDPARARGYLRQAGLSEDEIDSISKVDQLKYDAVIFSCLSDFNIQMLEDLTNTSLFSNDKEGGLVEGFAIVNEFSKELASVAGEIVKNRIILTKDQPVISEEKLSELKSTVSEEIAAKKRFDTAITELETAINDNLKSEQDLEERVCYQRIAEQLKFDLENRNKNSYDYNKDMIDTFTDNVKKTQTALEEVKKENRVSIIVDNNVVKTQLDLIQKFKEALKNLKAKIDEEPESLEKENFKHIVRRLESSFNETLLHVPSSVPDSKVSSSEIFDSAVIEAHIKAVETTVSSLEKMRRQSFVTSQASIKAKVVDQKQPKTFFQSLRSAVLDALNPSGSTFNVAFSAGLLGGGIAFAIFPPLAVVGFIAGFSTVIAGVSLGNATYDYRHQNNEKKPNHEMLSIKTEKSPTSTGGIFKKILKKITKNQSKNDVPAPSTPQPTKSQLTKPVPVQPANPDTSSELDQRARPSKRR